MDGFRDSELIRMLVADGLSQDRAGTRRLARKMRAKAGTNALNKKAGVGHGGDGQLSKIAQDMTIERSTGQEGSPIYLAWTNPAANTKRARGWTHLVLIDGGKQ